VRAETKNAGTDRAPIVNLVSETAEGLQGHGVHTVFLETRDALERSGVDVRVNSREPADIVHVQTMGLSSLSFLIGNKDHAVVTMHFVPESFLGSFVGARAWLPLSSVYMRIFLRRASHIVAVSPDVADWLERTDIGVPVHLVPNAIDAAQFRVGTHVRPEVREGLGIARDAFVALSVGQVQPRKGVEAFVATARSLPDVTFVWAGGMPFKRLSAGHDHMLRVMAAAPENCHFIGEVAHEDMPGIYAAADCLFFPSNQETFGLTIVEAAAAGLPLLLKDLPTYVPLFGDHYIAANEDSYAEWLTTLRDDPPLRAAYAASACALASRFDARQLAERLLRVYAHVMADAEGSRELRARRGRARPRAPKARQQWSLASWWSRR
jgi:1,2-diacylglycerol-3-alpha-glucose alpha-1,2-galactosyltransferase